MPNPNPRMLDEPGVMDRLYYISKSLKVPESELLDAMDRAMKADPELDSEYALYTVVFERLKIPKNRPNHLLRCREGGVGIKILIYRKGVWAPQPEDQDLRYQNLKPPHVKLRPGDKLIRPNAFISATRENRLVTMQAEVLERRSI